MRDWILGLLAAVGSSAVFIMISLWVGPYLTENQGVLVVGALAGVIAIWGVITQRRVARRHATVDHLFRLESDNDIIVARQVFNGLARTPEGLAIWADPSKDKEPEQRKIFTVLNTFELTSVGLQRGVYDMVIYARWYRSATILQWKRAQPFVQRVRERHQVPTMYHEFEELARRLEEKKPPARSWFQTWWS